jgi:VanZ family protein
VIFSASTDAMSADSTARLLHTILPASITPSLFETIHFAVRKAGHVVEYAILGVLLFRAIRGEQTGWKWQWAISAIIIAGLYAATDEWHQSFVPSRTPSVWDVLIDTTGATLAQVLFFRP